MIGELLEVLALMDEPPTADEVADALWLAGRLSIRPSAPATGRSAPGQAPPAGRRSPRPRAGPSPPGAVQRHPDDSPLPGTSVHLPAAPGSGDRGGVPAGVPAVPGIRSALTVQRALRPLQRRIPSVTEFELDEEATADAVADSGVWLTVCRPTPQRWLDAALVIDDSPSMTMWQRTAAEFRVMLERQGAFRDVRVWRVGSPPSGGVPLLRAHGSGSARDPGELIAPDGQRVVVVLSDCVNSMWGEGRMGALLETWGRAQPVVIVQPMPQRMWARYCPLFTPVMFHAAGRAIPNGRLEARPRTPSGKDLADRGLPVPVVELEARWLDLWARLVAEPGPRWSPGVAIFSRQRIDWPAVGAEPRAPAEPLDAVLQFRASASPTAFRLASYLAATPLSPSLMWLVQRVMLPGSHPGHLAEVLLSELLQQIDTLAADVGAVHFDFRPGVRELLLSGLSRTEVLRVWAEVSRFVSERLGSAPDFRAMFAAHARLGQSRAGDPFAVVAFHVLRALGGGYADIAKNPVSPAAGGVAGPPGPIPVGAVAGQVQERQVFGRGARSEPNFPSHPPGEAVTSSQPEQSGRQEPAGGEQPAIMGGVPVQNPNFTGREQLLLDLRAQLGTRASVLLPQALHGLGGVGKTQVAVEYVHRFATDYEVVWWISAEQISLIRSSLAELGTQMNIADEDDTTKTITNVLEALRQGRPYRRWILIFDNADSPEAVEEYLPYPTGHILITSRNPAWTSKAQALEVDVFSREESVQFIRQRGRDVSAVEADQLAEALGDLPLALEQAAAWQRETGMAVPDYLNLLNERMSELLSENRPTNYPRPVAATWGLALDQLTEKWPAAAELLRLCAFFSPEPIAERLLTAGRVLNLPDQLGRALRDPLEFSRAKRDIGRYALAKTNPGEKTVQVHRLVQAILRDQMTEAQRAAYRLNGPSAHVRCRPRLPG